MKIPEIKRGEIFALHTDTVLGIGCCTNDPKAIEKLYSIKSRPSQKQLIIFPSSINDLEKAYFFPKIIKDICKIYWPGPLTVVLRKKSDQSTQGFRHPKSVFIKNLIQYLQSSIYVTSANISGELPIQEMSSLKKVFGNNIDHYFENNMPLSGKPSTIIQVSLDGSKIELIREGEISMDEILKRV